MNEIFSIAGKVAVVTGGSGVLGSNIARGFLQAGAKVFIVGAHQERVSKMCGIGITRRSEWKGLQCTGYGQVAAVT